MEISPNAKEASQYEIILYYKYTPIENSKLLWEEQKKLCERLSLTGRLLIASEGINGTLEGLKENIDAYCKDLLSRPGFEDIVFKRSSGSGHAFPKLKVKLRNEIVSAHLGDEDVKPYEVTGRDFLRKSLKNGEKKDETLLSLICVMTTNIRWGILKILLIQR